ncbi:hypothetical protein P691DRAFT_757519 [Macrolepiota fuliginosa MF-IS2]|uniref:Uncharacterized protein n=1 Tax=Macrolepiota fuliginosa MF-IS2 TaxID=1400762 RepID=A0A9P6C6V3_9AGAR|nr:hypothetical protein P691DRAFT_757519 [Macrolepiota fuliginosa MF-IS2]
MPLIKPSPIVTSRLGVEVVTTTIFSPTPSAGSALNARPSLPVPAIAGGVVAGAVLAVVVTFIWIWWGKKIKETKQKQQEEVEKHRKTKYNTMRNARISGPKNHSYRPLLKRPPDDKRVKFAGDAKATATQPPADAIDPEKAKHMLFDNPNTLPPRPAWTADQRLRRTGSVIWPMPRNPLKKSSQNSIRSNNTESPSGQAGQESSSHNAEKSIPHKASNVSTHSNASGESRQGRVPANLILAALGNLGNRNSLHADDRQSSSSLWSYLFRAMPGARASQHSSDSAYHPPEHDQAFPVGTAL